MRKAKIVLTDAEKAELIRLMVRGGTKEIPLQRLVIIQAAAAGMSAAQISRTKVRLHAINVRHWINEFKSANPEYRFNGLIQGKSPGRPKQFRRRDEALLLVYVTDFPRASLKQMQKSYAAILGDPPSVETIRQILRRNGLVHSSAIGWHVPAETTSAHSGEEQK